ncbi:MAG: isoprenylcysteine carboxylmethyltransferase family protein [Chloroflexota bacterium]
MNANQKDTKTKSGAMRWVVRETLGNLILIAILFGVVGRWDWWNGWALSGIYILWTLGTILFILPVNPQMLAERTISGVKAGAKKWDMTMVSLMGLMVFAMYIVACLDVRFGWSPAVPLAAQVSALVICLLGYAVLLQWAMIVNAFFTTIVRIQTERQHTVVTRGPYHVVRHPGYLGTILFYLFTPILLGSLWALIPSIAAGLVLVMRTAKEDKTLQAELPG